MNGPRTLPPPEDASPASRLLILVSIVVVVAGLYFGRRVLIPLALAVVLAFLLTPVVGLLEKCRLARVASVLAAIAWILISKHLMGNHSPLTVTAFVYWIGTLLLGAVVVTTFGIPSLHYSTRALSAVAEQGLLATASTTFLWNWGLGEFRHRERESS